ncbi:MAG: TraB/GumN family protein [Alphaproteobacteria bacterium]
MTGMFDSSRHRSTRVGPARFIAVVALLVVGLVAGRPEAAAEPLLNGQGLLWRIDTPDSQPSYLFGTIHLTDDRVTKLPPLVAKTLAAADSLTLELVMSPEVMARLGAAMQMTDGRRLDRILGPEMFAEVVAAGTRYGLFEGVLRQIEPWAVSAVLSAPPAEMARSMAGMPTLDQTLQDQAIAAGIPVYALETVEEQLAALGGLPEADQVTMLRHVLEDQPDIDRLIEELTQFYLARDLSGLYAWMMAQVSGADQVLYDRFLERIVDTRNQTMASRLTDRLAEGNAFIAVGALHLPGDAGILNLLGQRGHTISRVF